MFRAAGVQGGGGSGRQGFRAAGVQDGRGSGRQGGREAGRQGFRAAAYRASQGPKGLGLGVRTKVWGYV